MRHSHCYANCRPSAIYTTEAIDKLRKLLFLEDILAAIILEVFVGGTYVPASTIAWIVLFLAHNQDIQTRLHKELLSVMGSDRQPLLADRQHLSFFEAVIYESLRLRNTGSLPHTCTEDVVINGYRISKGTIIVSQMNSMKQDENNFPDRTKFIPERFLDDKGRFHGRDHLIPFS